MLYERNMHGERRSIGKGGHYLGGIYADQSLRRPKEFPKSSAYAEDSDEEESTVGKMPPSDSEDE